MIIAHPHFTKTIEFSENIINTLIIEHALCFRSTVQQLTDQARGESGDFVLSLNNQILDFPKYIHIVTDVFNMDFSEKRISAKLNNEAITASESVQELTREVLQKINLFAGVIQTAIDYPVTYTDQNDITGVIKMLN